MVRIDVPNWRKIRMALGIVSLGTASIILAYVTWYTQTHFFAYQDRIDALLATLPPGEADPPPLLSEAVAKIEGERAINWVARGLVAEIYDKPMRQLEWHIVTALWSLALPLRLDEREIVALYANFMVFEGGRGLAYGARRYFDKAPVNLTLDEILGLLAISRAPRANSPERRPENYRRQLERLRRDYRRAADSG